MTKLPGIIEEAEEVETERQILVGRRGNELLPDVHSPLARLKSTTGKYLLLLLQYPVANALADWSLSALNAPNPSLSSVATLPEESAYNSKTYRLAPKLAHQPSFTSSSSSSSSSLRSSPLSLRRFPSWASRSSSSSSCSPNLITPENSFGNTTTSSGKRTPALQRVLDGEYSKRLTMALVALKLYGWLQRKAGWYENEPPVQVLINSKIVAPCDWPDHLKEKYGYSDHTDKPTRSRRKASAKRRL